MMIIIIINVYQHIRMISEGSCDTEDWCNDISQYYCFSCILDQINAGLVSRREFFKNIKNLTVQKLLTVSVLVFAFQYVYVLP